MDQHDIEALSGAFRDIHNHLRRLTRPVLDELDLSGPRFAIMMILKHHKSLKVSELQGKLQVAMSTVTKMADALEGAGYIERVRSPEDRRVVLLSLSAKGRDLVEQLKDQHFHYIESALQTLNNDELPALLDYLTRIADFLRDTHE